jgi:hypothetical protein
MKNVARIVLLSILVLTALTITACGGSTTKTPGGKPPIDPSGNWTMKFSDAGGNSFILSALFSQTGSVVTALNTSAAGNTSPFACVPFSATFANGQVLNVDQFSGDVNTSFGNIHFTSTLNTAGSHAAGTYTLTGNCWGVALSGTFTADEIPSLSGTWTGAITCIMNCPTGATAGTITATLTQNDSTGVVSGTYAVSGLPNISNGNVSTGQSDVLSGPSWQGSAADSNGNRYVIAGGPLNGTPGLGVDRSFNGQLFEQHDASPSASLATYNVTLSH